ncbi:conserved hypothetical protein [Ricinus communis]|uniref:Myb-like domain-containing protein n=1 Tax=Ricinus communis TaxID=3988 RepID=B9T104_RICCO|nr:conserved hypothetical protein [Ricinus communis]
MASKETQKWSREENKIFEMNYEHLMKEEWERVALLLPNKTVDDIKLHYKYLLEDIELIESGLNKCPRIPVKIEKNLHLLALTKFE